MVRALARALLVVILATSGCLASEVAARPETTEEYRFAPIFTLTDIFGKRLSLSDYKGKVVMLNFWATWCGPCRVEIPGFVKLQNRYKNQGFTIIGISLDDKLEHVLEFYKQMGMNYPVAVGNERLGELYGETLALPTTLLIGRDGRIYAKHFGSTDISAFEEEIKQLLEGRASLEAAGFKRRGLSGLAGKIEVDDPAEFDSDVPGVDLTKLSAEQKQAFKKQLEARQCTCGCNFNLVRCRHEDHACGISRKMARDELGRFLRSLP